MIKDIRQGLLARQGLLSPLHGRQGGGVRVTTALPGTPVIHWDFTDLSTMFEDDEATLPVDGTTGEVVRAVTNKGTFSTLTLTQSLADSECPTIVANPAAGQVSHALRFNNDDALGISAAEEAIEADFTVAFVGAFEATEDLGIYLQWSHQFLVSNDEHTLNFGGSIVFDGQDPNVSTDEWDSHALVCVNNGINKFFAPHTGGILSSDDEILNDEPDLDEAIIVGASVLSGLGFTYNGYLGQIIVWDEALSDGELNQFKDYVNAKYGITWA